MGLPPCYRCKSQPCVCKDGITLYHADCREVLPLLEVGSVDLVLTDPPYGIEQSTFRASLPDTMGDVFVDEIEGDNSDELAAWLLGWLNDIPAVVWGAQNWPHLLLHKGRWCCWDKRCGEKADKMLGSAFELAWENRHSGFDVMVRVLHGGVVNFDGGKRFHPTQKPVKLFYSILKRYKKAHLVLDPFAGSGTTGLACKKLRRKCIMVELEEKYCDIIAGRLGMPPLKEESKRKGFFV